MVIIYILVCFLLNAFATSDAVEIVNALNDSAGTGFSGLAWFFMGLFVACIIDWICQK